MEVKINREIRDYSEKVYFGLTLREFVFSILSCLVAVLIYFLLKPYFGLETLSWLCIIAAAPFAAIGFVKYNGMTTEVFILNFIRQELFLNRNLVFNPTNYYYELLNLEGDDKNKNNKKHFYSR